MKNIVPLFVIILFGCSLSSAQEFKISYDHSALKVTDLDRSAAFYAGILQLEEIEVPFENPIIRWFSLGGPLQLHLIEEPAPNFQKDIATHLAVRVSDMNTFIKHLEKQNIPYRDWSGNKQTIALRPDGIQQVYLQDPDGNWIEVNDATH